MSILFCIIFHNSNIHSYQRSLPGFLGRSGSPNNIGANILGHKTAKHPKTMVPIRIVFPVDNPSVAMISTQFQISSVLLNRREIFFPICKMIEGKEFLFLVK